MLSYQLAACFLSCPVLRCIPSSFLLMKANSNSNSDLRFSFSFLEYPSHVWRRVHSSSVMLGTVCAIGIWNPILVFPSFTVCASFPYGTTVYDCYPGSSCNECVWSCGKVFILLLSVFLRFEWVMDCLSVASAEVYHLSCTLSFLCRSCSNWVMGCLRWLWRCTYHCLAVTVWRSGARYCERAILHNCKYVSLVCEMWCWKIQYCAWFALEDVSLAYWKCVAMAASPVVFQLLCNTLWPRLVSVLLCAV